MSKTGRQVVGVRCLRLWFMQTSGVNQPTAFERHRNRKIKSEGISYLHILSLANQLPPSITWELLPKADSQFDRDLKPFLHAKTAPHKSIAPLKHCLKLGILKSKSLVQIFSSDYFKFSTYCIFYPATYVDPLALIMDPAIWISLFWIMRHLWNLGWHWAMYR